MYQSITEYIGDDKRHTTSTGSRRPITYPGDVTIRRDRVSTSDGKHRFSAPVVRPEVGACRSDVTTCPYVAMTGSDRHLSRSDVNSSEDFYVEMSTPKSIKNSHDNTARDVSKTRIQGKAVLQLAIYSNSGMLTVHLRHARHLRSTDGSMCNAYVKVSMEPDDTKMSRSCTDVVRQSNHPVFEEKFSFELLEEDVKKRVLISVLNRKSDGSESEFLGGMSFGVWHVYTQKKRVDGWYYLLDNNLARRKHVRVTSKEQHKDIKNIDNGIGPITGNSRQEYTEGFNSLSTYKTPLGTSTPQKHRRRSRIYVSSVSCLQLIEGQQFINRRHCNDWEFIYDMSTRSAVGLTETNCEDDEQVMNCGRGFDIKSLESARRLQQTTRSRAERNKQSHDADERLTSSKAVGHAIRECVKKALTTPLKPSSYNKGKFLPDISKISHLDNDNIRLMSTDSSSFQEDSLSDGTLVPTSTDVDQGEEAMRTYNAIKSGSGANAELANGHPGTKGLDRDTCEASEESYIYAVSRACEAFMSRVDGSRQRRHCQTSDTRPTKEPSDEQAIYSVNGLSFRLPQKPRPTRHVSICGSETKENYHHVHDYVNSAIIETHFGEKRKRHTMNLTDLGYSASTLTDLSYNASSSMTGLGSDGTNNDLLVNGTAVKDNSVMSVPTKRRKIANLSFSINKDPPADNEKKDKDTNRKRTSWRSSFRRVFRSRESGSSSSYKRSLMAPETGSEVNSQQKKIGLVDRMKGLRIGIRNSFSMLTKKDKQDL